MSDLITAGVERHSLTEQQKSVKNTLQPFEQEWVHLRQERPINSYGQREIKTFCLKIITKAFVDMTPTGIPDNKMLAFQTECLVKELQGNYGGLTVSEIEFAFSEGIRGVAGQYFGLCPKTYHQFLKWIYEHPQRSESWVKYLNGIDTLKFSDKPVKLTSEALLAAAKGAFKEYKESGKLPFVPHAIYDTIKELAGLKTLIDSNEWLEVQYEAREALEKRHKSPKGEKSVTEILNMESRTWEFEVKKIGLKRFFDKLINEGKTLEL